MYSSGYRRIAREALRGKWKKMLGLLFISALLINGLNLDSLANNCFSRPEHYYFSFDVAGLGYRYTVNRVFGFGWVLMAAYALIRLLIAPAVSAGEYALAQDALRGEALQIRRLFPMSLKWKLLGMNLLRALIIALWSLLLVVPGIVAVYRYSMADYLLINHPEMGAVEALRRSKELMYGNKMSAFSLDMSFIGWALLTCAAGWGIQDLLGINGLGFSALKGGFIVLDLLSVLIALPLNAYRTTAMTAFFIAVEQNTAHVEQQGAEAAPDPMLEARRAAEEQARQNDAATASAREMYMQHHCSRRLIELAGLDAEYEAYLGGRSYQEDLWRREYVDQLMRRFDGDPSALDDIIALAGEYGMDDLADRALGRIDRHIWQQTLPDAEILNLLGRMLALLQAESFAGQSGFVARKKRQILDMAERLERRLNEIDPDGAWREAMRAVREAAAE